MNTRTAIIFIALCVGATGLLAAAVYASSHPNIDPVDHWAWNDVIGWIDFCGFSGAACTFGVRIPETDGDVTGYASSSVGYIGLNCNTPPPGGVVSCAGAGNWKVSRTGNVFSGWAWNDVIGWISFCGDASGGATWNGSLWTCPASPTYQVSISGGRLSGFAWNEVAGWISFDCNDVGLCVPDYGVDVETPIPKVGILDSNVFDTSVVSGASINGIIWQGSENGGNVLFQVAASNCVNGATNAGCTVGTWGSTNCDSQGGVNSCFIGPDGTPTYDATVKDAYAPNSGEFRLLRFDPPCSTACHSYYSNKRYVRYRIILEPDPSTGASPVVHDVVLHVSP